MDSGGDSLATALPPIGGALPVAAGTTAGIARPTSAAQEEAESTETALRLLRERLPPLRPPSPIKRVFRPVPPTLNYAAPRSRGSGATTAPKHVDLDKESKLIEKTQLQRRSVLEAEAQKGWTHILVQHLHRLAELEESVPYREASMREALLREEDREYMILAVEHETRMRRIRGRDLVGIQLKKHMLAIEQEDTRKLFVAEQAKEFQEILRREAVYRPAMPEERSPNRVARALVGSKGKQLAVTATRDPSQTLVGGDTTARRPKPPQPRVNSARGEDRYVSNGRLMWGQQKLQQFQLRAIDTAVAALPATEQLRREEAEGQELDARLYLERRFADASHDLKHLYRALKLQAEEEERAQLQAHDRAASAAVHLVLDHVLATVGGRLEEVPPLPFAVISLEAATEGGNATAGREATALAAGPPTTERRSSKTRSSSIVGITSDASGASSETSMSAAPRRRDSIVKRVEAPATKVDEQRLIAAAVANLDDGAPRLRTALELLAMVDEQNQALFPCADEEAWKFSGIAALRLAQLPIQSATNSALSVPGASQNAPSQQQQQVLPSPDATPQVVQQLEQRQQSPPTTRSLFASFDLLCGVMIREDPFEELYPSLRECAHAAVQMEEEAFGGSSDRVLSECRDLRRLAAGHRDAALNRDYLEHVLWRTTLHIKGIVNAIELIPTRWSAYETPFEMEDEECLVVNYSETLAREKIIREQIDEFLSVLRYVDQKRSKAIQR